MLEHLDDVPWDRLEHAYGSATDVPDLIRNLASPDAEIRDKALDALYSNIWHQDTVYQATAYAVPFIIELVQEPSVQDKDRLLLLLANLASGSSYWDVHQHSLSLMDIVQERRSEIESEIETELGWVKAARDAVFAGHSLYRELLVSGDERVRTAAAYVLSIFREAAGANFETLRGALAVEKKERVRSAEVLAIGSLAAAEQRILPFLEELLASSEERSIQVASALGLAWVSPRSALSSESELRALTLLCEVAEYPGAMAEVFDMLPGLESDIVTDSCDAVWVLIDYMDSMSPATRVTRVLPSMIAALDRVPRYRSWNHAECLLSLVFGGKPMPESATFATLSSEQQMVLEAMQDSDNFWGDDEEGRIMREPSLVMHRFGLPERRKKLRAFLRGELSPRSEDWKGT